MGYTQQVPRARLLIGVFDHIVLAFAAYAKTVSASSITEEVLKRPVRISAVGHHDSEVTGAFGFELNRSFQPAFVGKAHHQPSLIELMNGKRVDSCGNDGIARHLRVQEVSVVHSKAVVSSLPEVGLA